MNIIISKYKNSTKIIVQKYMSVKDVDYFLEATKYIDITYEINFINIRVLPLEVLKRIYVIKDNSKIFTDEISLRDDFKSFNIDAIYEDDNLKIKKQNKICFIGIGGSAGSLEKVMSIVKNLPLANISIFILIHQQEDKKSLLEKILQNQTSYYNVVEVEFNQKVTPKTIYIAPPGKHMIIENGYIYLIDTERRNFSKPSISVLYNSLAKEYKGELLSILLCGYGYDGSDSLKNLKNNGATVIIEDSKECEATPMLDNAVKTGNYDAILALDDINKYIFNSIKNI